MGHWCGILDCAEAHHTIFGTAARQRKWQYVYFAVADPFFFDLRESLVIEYSVWDDDHAWHVLQYDSHDPEAVLAGAYKDAERVRCGESGIWITHRLEIEDARFVNRQNGGADFRLLAVNGRLAVRNVTVRKTGRDP